ncbi:MAG: phosphatidate cytidylyltransferase [Nitrospirales bacterium]
MDHEQTMQAGSDVVALRRRPDARRVYAALVFIPLFYLLVRHLPPLAFFALVAGAALLAQYEFYRLHFRETWSPWILGVGLAAGLGLLVSLQWPALVSERVVLLGILAAALASPLASRVSLERSLLDASVLVFGVLYVALTLGHLVLARALEQGEFLIFFLFLVTWAGDTGAYYAGVAFGRHRLAPVVSPNKTIEGLIGGLGLAVVIALVAQIWFLPSWTLAECAGLGIGLTLIGVVGDLSESALKRSAGVKDSGVIIPGHGGVLDRLDSLLFTAPAFYYYVTLVK